MTTTTPIRVAAATVDATSVNGGITSTLLEAMVKRLGFVLATTESLGDYTQASGEIALMVWSAATGSAYFYDSTDSTTADDGVTCLVDASGHRYFVHDSADLLVNSVLSETNTPPGSPSVGDKYIVGTAPTGAWAAHAKDLAVYTRRGWVYGTPSAGLTVLDKTTDTNKQYSEAGAWGAFPVEIAAASIKPVSLAFPMGLPVESVLNTPPGSPTANTYWVVGTVPTGAFVGHAGSIAYYVSAAWEFIAAYEGATVFNRALGYELTYISGVWAGATGSDYQSFTTVGANTWTKPSKGSVAFVQVWGGGGSGGRAGSGNSGGGGGGGGYNEWLIPLASLGATETVTIGAGGPSITANDTNGTTGGNTTFGSWLTGYGGGPGVGVSSSVAGGGGGGGSGSVGLIGSVTLGGNGGSANGETTAVGVGGLGVNSINGGAAGGGTSGLVGYSGGTSRTGGGGGGAGRDSASGAAGSGGDAKFGGGGGGGAGRGGASSGPGGTSKHGGAGGAGAAGATAATAGSQPGGGGGGSETGNSGKGGDGMCRVTVW
ncbi:MAG: DUF2793 domain-containing protein [Hyphomicrobium sp.]|jgi:hypothetical protein